jgi:hypothetical protein
MFADQITQLRIDRVNVKRLERLVMAQLQSELKQLPERYGFANTITFVRALQDASRKQKKSEKDKNSSPRKRAIITNAMRLAVRNMANAGRSEAEISRVIDISVASVRSILKNGDLVKSRQ